ncbi:hypothetical protein [Mesobacillus selenatarsenatis]|uniref:Uncharacterized protein n=1 Tax=Mesobacillus selenatarsenatis (strain DSM 18680 / JCM 14380 / FERM P-15431 / SF-1) TaxID=1321606 RepID=A0A0A8X0W2_MESS1|nr:hypothetical protein [Mesobacillus selenatarsenatis]GAM12854.1 hypothetical protein SAMD00020551_0989 [Mesobacillus selenatarsenatis SF-1]
MKKVLLGLIIIFTTLTGIEMNTANPVVEMAAEKDPGSMHSIELSDI